MRHSDRRRGFRISTNMFFNEYIADRPYRALAGNLSETGVLLNRVKSARAKRPCTSIVGLEFQLPGTNETIWARGEICSSSRDPLFDIDHVRFTDMPKVHARMLRDYCITTRHSDLQSLLSRLRY